MTNSPLAQGLVAFRIGVWLFSYALFAAMLFAGGALRLETTGFLLLLACAGMVLSGAVETAVNRTRQWPQLRRFATVSLVVLIITTLNAVIDVATLGRSMAPASGVTLRFALISGLQSFTFLVWIHAFYAASVWLVGASIDLVEKERRLVEAESETQKATLRALRSQIHPHFLFNALNAAASLVSTQRNHEAEELIVRLSDFFRSSLSGEREPMISLSEEFDTLDAYLQIERIRFPDRLEVSLECPSDLAETRIPSFLLQPLVENAIKHAVAASSTPVHVSVRALRAHGRLKLQVEDEGAGPKHENLAKGEGVGLRNVSERLRVIFGADADVRAAHTVRGFRVDLDLPLDASPT